MQPLTLRVAANQRCACPGGFAEGFRARLAQPTVVWLVVFFSWPSAATSRGRGDLAAAAAPPAPQPRAAAPAAGLCPRTAGGKGSERPGGQQGCKAGPTPGGMCQPGSLRRAPWGARVVRPHVTVLAASLPVLLVPLACLFVGI